MPATAAAISAGYWVRVFARARAIAKEHPAMTGDEAFEAACKAENGAAFTLDHPQEARK